MQLRPYQEKAIAASQMAEREGVRCQLIVKPTGTGKTVTFSHLIAQRQGRALALAHRDELLQQAKDKISRVLPGARIGIVRGDLNQHAADIVVASVQTLGREKRLAKLTPDFQTVIIDEAHHVSAASYGRIIEHIAASNPLLVGFTATPYRGDGKPICADDEHATGTEWFSKRVFEMSIAEAVEDGWLAEPVGRLIHLPTADFNKLHTKRGDYDTSELEEMLRAANWHEHITRALTDHAAGRRTVVFVPPKRVMAYDLEKHLNTNGFRAAAVTGEMDHAKRREVYHAFETGALNVLISVDVLTEGWDSPRLDCVMMARPTKSKTVYVQAIGRGLRIAPGKENCLVLDMVGATVRHDLMTLSALTGVKRQKDGETFRQAQKRAEKEEEEQKAREEQERIRIEAEHRAREVQLLKIQQWRQRALEQSQEPRPRAFHWANAGVNHQTMIYADMLFTVRIMADKSWLASGDENRIKVRRQQICDTVDDAKVACETWARNLAPRQSDAPPTEKQIQTLMKFRIRFDPATITKREASQLIGDRIAELQSKRQKQLIA